MTVSSGTTPDVLRSGKHLHMAKEEKRIQMHRKASRFSRSGAFPTRYKASQMRHDKKSDGKLSLYPCRNEEGNCLNDLALVSHRGMNIQLEGGFDA